MTDRPEHASEEPLTERPGYQPVAAEEPGVIIVPYRPGRHSAKLLPPIVLVLLGTGFLTYRARSNDWRGISSLFESRPNVVKAAAPPALALSTEPAPIVPEPLPPIAEKVGEPEKTEPKLEPKSEPEPKPEPQPQRKPEPAADPLDEIQREADATRQRIAELEKLKEREAQKLDETAEERERADRLNRRNTLRFRVGQQVPPEVIERMLRAQQAELRRQMQAMAEFQRRQMDQMAALQRDFFNDRDRMMRVPPPPQPQLGRPERQAANPDVVERKLPNGGIARFREFRGPNGQQGFQFEIRSRELTNDDDTPIPPPPQPALRLRDWGIVQ